MKLTETASGAIRDRLSMRTRRRIAEKRVRVRRLTGRLRSLPDFLIIGAQRCGTSSLYRYLGAHPELTPSLRKETQYFSRRFSEDPLWYRAHFPLSVRLGLKRAVSGLESRTFEASPDYLFHPLAAERVHDALPGSKLIVVLREPAERTYSHYKHMRRLLLEDLSFEDALDAEEERISHDFEQLKRDMEHPFTSALRFSYVSRSLYSEQLERWFARFDRDRFLIIDAHDFFADEKGTLSTICGFLGITDWAPAQIRNHSQSEQGSSEIREGILNDATRQRLEDLFARENERLTGLTGRTFSWVSG